MNDKTAKAYPTKAFFVNMITRDITFEDCILDLIDNSVDGASRSEHNPRINLEAGWPRAVTHPRLPRIRACPIRAPGSSDNGLAAQRYTLCTTRTGGRG